MKTNFIPPNLYILLLYSMHIIYIYYCIYYLTQFDFYLFLSQSYIESNKISDCRSCETRNNTPHGGTDPKRDFQHCFLNRKFEWNVLAFSEGCILKG